MKKIRIGNKIIGEDQRCFTIAEAGANHDGDLAKALKLIDAAIDTPRTRPIFAGDKEDSFFCKPTDIANEILMVNKN